MRSRLLLILFLGILAACGGRVELLKEISEAEANEAMAALLSAGISAGKLPGKEGVVSLDVDQAQVARAISILNAEGLPRERYAKMGDVFRKEGLISSPLEERARYLWALSQELSATVSQIDGVIKARVHVVLPEKSSGSDPAMPSSAAVFIKHKQSYQLDDAVPQIKRLIANSIPGLSAEKVSVVLIAANTKSPTEAKSSADTATTNNTSRREPEYALDAKLIWAACVAVLLILMGLGYGTWRKWRRQTQEAAAPTEAAKG